jgi:Protein of unknown function (DUF4230)
MSEGTTRAAMVPLILLTALSTAAITATFTAKPLSPTSVTTTVRATPDVLRAVRDLARLESVSFHMERVIDLRETQQRAFGLLEAEDAILLVASADVTAGVDLSTLTDGDVVIDARRTHATLTLPHARVLSTRLDAEHTFVHSRTTDLFARRQEQLESRARREAERSLEAGAIEAGILRRAEENAARTLSGLVRALGVGVVEVRWR